MINYSVRIINENYGRYFTDYTSNAVFPIKFANFLDEQLDEAQLTLKRITEKYFKPTTLVEITITNTPEALFSSDDFIRLRDNAETKGITYSYDSNTKRITETKTLKFIVANDNSIEQPIGSGLYNHEIYLIELTKILEGHIGESITFTNALGNNYLDS